MPQRKQPAGEAGHSVVMLLAGNEETTQTAPETQGPWADMRTSERLSIDTAKAALTQRGADRLAGLALAAVYAGAARNAALIAGAAR